MNDVIGKTIPVLDKGWVEVQDVMGDDMAIVAAARTSLLGESKGAEQDKRLLFYLMEHHHDSPFEMAEMKFRIHAPELVWRHILRHRAGSYNLQSYRYTEAEEDEFYIPDVWRLQDSKNKQGSAGELDDDKAKWLTHRLTTRVADAYHAYQNALEKGVAREQARLFLPAFALYSVGVVKMDIRNLMHFLSLRQAPEAQWETRQYADAMNSLFVEAFPLCAQARDKFRGDKS